MKAVLFVSLLVAACAEHAPSASAPARAGAERCQYEVEVVSSEPAELAVDMRCQGNALKGIALADDTIASFVHDVHEVRTNGKDIALDSHKNHFKLAEPEDSFQVHYRIDLEGMTRDGSDFDVALRVGHSLIAPTSSYLLYPEPLRVDVASSVHERGSADFITGLRNGPLAGSYALAAHEIPVATYSAFGKFTHREFDLSSGAKLQLAVLDGKLDSDIETLATWVHDSAEAVSQFWQRFPDDQALVVIVPVRGRSGVIFGKVLPESAPGVVILMGEHTSREKLYSDWVLVHELFHIGFPSFHEEGKWLDEGLATYYEPIIRARAGWIDERTVWDEFMSDMPQGLHAMNELGLERGDDYRDIYWGGAIFCLLADMTIRERSGGRLALEDGLRGVLRAGGNSSEVWALSDVLDVADSALGMHVLNELARRHAFSTHSIELDALWKKLGVQRAPNGARLDDSAPLASLRRTIVRGNSDTRTAQRPEP